MIIVISGKAGSGKSTVAKLLAKKLKYKHYSNGDFMREMAENKKISLLQLSKLAEIDKSIDKELDDRQIKLGKKEDNFVIDSRLGFYFIPNSKKIFLDAKLEIRTKRILNDKERNEANETLEQTKKNIIAREKSEAKRYMQYYKLNPYNPLNYQLVIDTSSLTPDEVADKVMNFIKIS